MLRSYSLFMMLCAILFIDAFFIYFRSPRFRNSRLFLLMKVGFSVNILYRSDSELGSFPSRRLCIPLSRSHIPIIPASLTPGHARNSRLIRVFWYFSPISNITSSSTVSFMKLKFKWATWSQDYNILISFCFDMSQPRKFRTLLLLNLVLSWNIPQKQPIKAFAFIVESRIKGN